MDRMIQLKIKTLYNDLSPTEKKIADYVLDHPSMVSHRSISDIANSLDIADSTFFQFTKKLGYNGFKEFKTALLLQESTISVQSLHENIQQGDTELTIAHKIFQSNISALNDTVRFLDERDLHHAVTLINHSKRLYFFGVGGSEIIASDAYHKFLRASVPVVHSTDYHIQIMEASLLTTEDCAICISHSGQSKETIAIAKAAKKNGCSVIVLTSHAGSPLAKLADIVLLSIAEETEFRSEALTSRISQLSLMDSLYVMLMFTNQKRAHKSISIVRDAIRTIKE